MNFLELSTFSLRKDGIEKFGKRQRLFSCGFRKCTVIISHVIPALRIAMFNCLIRGYRVMVRKQRMIHALRINAATFHPDGPFRARYFSFYVKPDRPP